MRKPQPQTFFAMNLGLLGPAVLVLLSCVVTTNGQSEPIDCYMSQWGVWGPCSVTCGKGVYYKHRLILTHEQYGGSPCGATSLEASCYPVACPTYGGCDDGDDEDDDCKKTTKDTTGGGGGCGGGAGEDDEDDDCGKTTEYPTTKPPCDEDDETGCETTHPCDKDPYDPNCLTTPSTTPYTTPTTAYTTPSTDYTTPSTEYTTPSTDYTTPSTDYTTPETTPYTTPTPTKPTPTKPTPTPSEPPCHVSEWSGWGPCLDPETWEVVECNGGRQNRTRTMTPPFCACLSEIEFRLCNQRLCEVDCLVTVKWTCWSACSETCGNGGCRTRKRIVLTHALAGGNPCPPEDELVQSQPCPDPYPCPSDCVMSAWGAWSGCSEECGPGIKTRTRTVSQEPVSGGKACPVTWQQDLCHGDCTPRDCEVSEWTSWPSRGEDLDRSSPSAEPKHEPALAPKPRYYKPPVFSDSGKFGRVGLLSGIPGSSRDGGGPYRRVKRSIAESFGRRRYDHYYYDRYYDDEEEEGDSGILVCRARFVEQFPAFGGDSCPVLIQAELTGSL